MAQIPPVIGSARLLRALRQCGDHLGLGTSNAQTHTSFLADDPASPTQAHAADSALDLDAMLELEAVLSGLARKLNMGMPSRAKKDLDKTSQRKSESDQRIKPATSAWEQTKWPGL